MEQVFSEMGIERDTTGVLSVGEQTGGRNIDMNQNKSWEEGRDDTAFRLGNLSVVEPAFVEMSRGHTRTHSGAEVTRASFIIGIEQPRSVPVFKKKGPQIWGHLRELITTNLEFT